MKDLAAIRAMGFRRYLSAVVRSGWAWLLAAVLVLANGVAATVSIAKDDPAFLIASPAFLVLPCWLFYRGHQLAVRDAGTQDLPR